MTAIKICVPSSPQVDPQEWSIRRPDGRFRRLPLTAIILIGLVLPIASYLFGGEWI